MSILLEKLPDNEPSSSQNSASAVQANTAVEYNSCNEPNENTQENDSPASEQRNDVSDGYSNESSEPVVQTNYVNTQENNTVVKNSLHNEFNETDLEKIDALVPAEQPEISSNNSELLNKMNIRPCRVVLSRVPNNNTELPSMNIPVDENKVRDAASDSETRDLSDEVPSNVDKNTSGPDLSTISLTMPKVVIDKLPFPVESNISVPNVSAVRCSPGSLKETETRNETSVVVLPPSASPVNSQKQSESTKSGSCVSTSTSPSSTSNAQITASFPVTTCVTCLTTTTSSSIVKSNSASSTQCSSSNSKNSIILKFSRGSSSQPYSSSLFLNSAQYTPTCRSYAPSSSQYLPSSPSYSPSPQNWSFVSGYSPSSPSYAPTSPSYCPSSALYIPTSPRYAPIFRPTSPRYNPVGPMYRSVSPLHNLFEPSGSRYHQSPPSTSSEQVKTCTQATQTSPQYEVCYVNHVTDSFTSKNGKKSGDPSSTTLAHITPVEYSSPLSSYLEKASVNSLERSPSKLKPMESKSSASSSSMQSSDGSKSLENRLSSLNRSHSLDRSYSRDKSSSSSHGHRPSDASKTSRQSSHHSSGRDKSHSRHHSSDRSSLPTSTSHSRSKLVYDGFSSKSELRSVLEGDESEERSLKSILEGPKSNPIPLIVVPKVFSSSKKSTLKNDGSLKNAGCLAKSSTSSIQTPNIVSNVPNPSALVVKSNVPAGSSCQTVPENISSASSSLASHSFTKPSRTPTSQPSSTPPVLDTVTRPIFVKIIPSASGPAFSVVNLTTANSQPLSVKVTSVTASIISTTNQTSVSNSPSFLGTISSSLTAKPLVSSSHSLPATMPSMANSTMKPPQSTNPPQVSSTYVPAIKSVTVSNSNSSTAEPSSYYVSLAKVPGTSGSLAVRMLNMKPPHSVPSRESTMSHVSTSQPSTKKPKYSWYIPPVTKPSQVASSKSSFVKVPTTVSRTCPSTVNLPYAPRSRPFAAIRLPVPSSSSIKYSHSSSTRPTLAKSAPITPPRRRRSKTPPNEFRPITSSNPSTFNHCLPSGPSYSPTYSKFLMKGLDHMPGMKYKPAQPSRPLTSRSYTSSHSTLPLQKPPPSFSPAPNLVRPIMSFYNSSSDTSYSLNSSISSDPA